MSVIACARTACHPVSLPTITIPAAKVIMLGKAIVRFRVLVGLRTSGARFAAVLAINCGSGRAPVVIFLFATFANTTIDRNLMISLP
jgi:hypothetical protein